MNFPRGWAFGLLGSLAINFFIAGYVLSSPSSFLRPQPTPTELAPSPDAGPQPQAQIQAVEQTQRAAPRSREPAPQTPAIIRRVLQGHDASIRPRVLAAERANVAVIEALAAEPFDPADLARALEDVRVKTLESQKAMHDAMVEAVAAMTREQRSQLADVGRRNPGRPVIGR